MDRANRSVRYLKFCSVFSIVLTTQPGVTLMPARVANQPGPREAAPVFCFGGQPDQGGRSMSDAQGSPLQFAGEGTPPNASQPAAPNQQTGGEQQTADGAKYLTAGDVAALFEDMFNRKAQSISTKTANRVQQIIDAAQTRGVSITSEQAQAVLDAVDGQTPTQPPAQPRNPAPTPPTPAPAQAQPGGNEGQPGQLHPVLQTAQAMMQRAGVEINDDDPEVAKIDSQTTDELTFLQSVQAAITAKAERLKKAGAPARMPSMTGGGQAANPVVSITDPNELWKLATRK